MLGVTLPDLRKMCRPYRRHHALALALWKCPIQEARLAAVFIDDWRAVTRGQMETWARDFDNWALVDGCCGNLFDRTPFVVEKALAWSRRRSEFVKRAGFVLMATCAIHRKDLDDAVFLKFLEEVERGANDDRNFVRKAVNWALRQIGKRGPTLRVPAIGTAKRILAIDTTSARWIARDALRELRDR